MTIQIEDLSDNSYDSILVILLVTLLMPVVFIIIQAQSHAADDDLHPPPPQPSGKYHAFFSHYQTNAFDQVATIYNELGHRGYSIWCSSNTSLDVTDDGMRAGVQDSDVFVLFLTHDVFRRPYCRVEINTALDAKKHIILVKETMGEAAFGDIQSEIMDDDLDEMSVLNLPRFKISVDFWWPSFW